MIVPVLTINAEKANQLPAEVKTKLDDWLKSMDVETGTVFRVIVEPPMYGPDGPPGVYITQEVPEEEIDPDLPDDEPWLRAKTSLLPEHKSKPLPAGTEEYFEEAPSWLAVL